MWNRLKIIFSSGRNSVQSWIIKNKFKLSKTHLTVLLFIVFEYSPYVLNIFIKCFIALILVLITKIAKTKIQYLFENIFKFLYLLFIFSNAYQWIKFKNIFLYSLKMYFSFEFKFFKEDTNFTIFIYKKNSLKKSNI